MLKKPMFKPQFRCETMPLEGVFLLSETDRFLLRGTPYTLLAPLLNGNYTVTEIVDRLQDRLSVFEIYTLLDRLKELGYIIESTDSIPEDRAAFYQIQGIEPAIATHRLQEIALSILSYGNIDPHPFATQLDSLGINCSDEGTFAVALTDDYLQTGLDACNRDAIQRDRPWMLVKPVGVELWIGPIFIPGKTGCWHCLAHYLRGHRPLERYLQEHHQTENCLPTAVAAIPATVQTALSIAATEIAKWAIASQHSRLEGQILTLNTLTWEQRYHKLWQRPQCPCCGNPESLTIAHFAPIVLQSRPKSFTRDGGHRSHSPDYTYNTLADRISPICGAIATLQRISTWETPDGLTHSYRAQYPTVGTFPDLHHLQEGLRTEAYGKGRQDIQAKVSALCEAIERYAGTFQGDEPRICSTLSNLDNGIHPNACMQFSARQFQNRTQLNGDRITFDWIPEPLDENAEIEWTPAWSLTHNQLRYLPTAYCYSGYSQQHQAYFTRADSNGCAAGNNLEEAILQGFLELVERDSIALWWYNRLRKPAVELSSFDEPYFDRLQEYYRTLNRDLWVLDLTADLQIPTFAAISPRRDRHPENILLGFGAHFDPRLALLRALTELNQSLPAAFYGILDATTAYRDRDREGIDWWETATLANHPYLLPDSNQAPKTRPDYPHCWSDDLHTDILACVERVRAKGMETLVVNQTRPDLSLSVVKVVVPGLRHFWPRFASGRLYDVPDQMGWVSEPLTEAQLNPLPAFF
ncbi:TOMM precursor leader peptide-binding protein [Oscillatoria acuminata]|uniref:Bacteriocin biosynthesis cyclodehydratase domain protein n=1 Tax=Oscillatoria acuminata PCC 6304 TaxID=56110 RepID=K9TQ74_9CYAN|nr:TOMM precursor leader peptide-binding protein [Oscillatoria acuminata]AFY84705.1 bacteriocin biosynthesis cyclodehydratase domain protein [Oscillatoria acuminata PCC 6304]